MTRLQADLTLGLAGLIWGFGFVAQKDALGHIGPFTFVAARFALSALVVLPLVWRERAFDRLCSARCGWQGYASLFALGATFSGAVLLQQVGIGTTTVTNTAFLTGLYIVMVPLAAWLLYRHRILPSALIAGALSVLGIWLLAGGSPDRMPQNFGLGDALVLGCTVCFAFQVPLLGQLAQRMRAPFILSFLQYLAVGVIALALAVRFETIDFAAIRDAWGSILYAGIASGGIAYTLQAVAQQHTPSADTAIILSTESLFGGLGGVWLLGERLTATGMIGCGAIIAAIIVVELGPLWKKRRAKR